jgi:coenzyme F420-dependent glucose-6-phosphate dehydrogenase
MPLKLGYKASAEQFAPRELLEYAVEAERQGLEIIAVSDHFQPFRHTGGHGTAALPWLGAVGERTESAQLGTSVLTPTLRYHPSIIAHAFGTLALLNPGRVFLGVGTGESVNETPATGAEWPGAKERRLRLAEGIDLMRRLWTEERVTYEGEYYRTKSATIYDRPDELVPIYVAASGPLAATLAGRVGDGFIVTSGKDPALYEELNAAMEGGAVAAGRDPAEIVRMIEIKVSYDHDLDLARVATEYWAPLALTPEQKRDVEDPLELERLADEDPSIAQRRFIASDDPDEVIEKIAPYVALGFDHLVFHAPGNDQRRFLDQFCADVVPLLRDRFSVATTRQDA